MFTFSKRVMQESSGLDAPNRATVSQGHVTGTRDIVTKDVQQGGREITVRVSCKCIMPYTYVYTQNTIIEE